MAFDAMLAERVRKILIKEKGFSEKKMFGGICFLLDGNMCCGVEKKNLMVRVGAKNYEKFLGLAHARPMDFTGRPLKGLIYVGEEGLNSSASLKKWVDRAIGFVRTLPPK